jgi:hypothetical protein
MALTHFAQVVFEFLNCRVAFPLVACRDDEDKRFGLGTRLEKFVDQASSYAQS